MHSAYHTTSLHSKDMTHLKQLQPGTLHHHFARHLPDLSRPTTGEAFPHASMIATNDQLAAELGLRDLEDASLFTGQPGHALGYSGHQFGGFSPVLGDGRAMLLGEIDTTGDLSASGLRDLHLKGSGRTPYSKPGADGRLPLGAALREYLISEFLHSVGVPTTRVLAVISTGKQLQQPRNKAGDPFPPGAIIVRVARHHIRVGTFQHAALHGPELVRDLVDYTLARHGHIAGDNPAVTLFRQVAGSQATLIAKWMRLGFVHGVLNTDNVSAAGESIDFGPCAFLDRYDPSAVFSSIDAQGRYSYASQPTITQWNLARFAEALLPVWGDDSNRGVAELSAELQTFPEYYNHAYSAEMTAALGANWQDVIEGFDRDTDYAARLHQLNQDNPLNIPRNHTVQAALTAAETGDLQPFTKILAALQNPYGHAEAGLTHMPEAEDETGFISYCGT